MEPLTFSEIAGLLSHSRATKIADKPVDQMAGNWEIYKGEHRIHTETIPFEVLYIQSKATADGLKTASKRLRGDRFYVVYAPSLDLRLKMHHDLFRDRAKGFWTTTEYLQSYFGEELDAYNRKLSEQNPRFYIEPDVEVPAGVLRKIPNPLLSFLEDVSAASEISTGEIGVLLAGPGQGKTTMSQFLASRLAQSKKAFPIHISSDQWRSIAPDDLGNLAKTITHSFRHFGAPISWLDGCEDDFLKVTLKARLFRIVFDGFDEYVLRNHGRISALETLRALANFVETTGSRIVVTSRTSFWNSELENIGNSLDGVKLSVYTQAPFDTGKAQKYFRVRLGNENQINRATQLYDQLQKRNREFVGRGFVLNLLADLISREQGQLSTSSVGNPVEWLMAQLCERERLRQELPITADEQLQLLALFVSETAQGAEPTSELLEIALTLVAPRLGADLRRACVERLQPHPLIVRPQASEDFWEVPQEQIRVVILAGWLMGLARESNVKELTRFSERAKLDDNDAGDIAEMIVDLASTKPTLGKTVDQLGVVIGSFLSVSGNVADSSARQHCLRRLAVITALRAVDRLQPKGSAHSDRTELLMSFFASDRFWNLEFSGAISRMDFSGHTFEHCRFERVRWADCTFDANTRFQSCHFVGGSSSYCRGLGDATFENLTADDEGHAFVNTARVAAGSKKYSVENLRTDMRTVINKFVVKGGIGLRTVRESYLDAGTIGSSPHKAEIIAELKRFLLEEHHISGISDKGLNVRDEAAECIKFYASNNVFTGPLLSAFEALQLRLGLKPQ